MIRCMQWLMGLAVLLATPLAQAGTVTYVYTDPQGTPLAEADASGNITARFEYTPYGVSVPSVGAAPNGVGYTGHVNDPESGFVYMQARYYDAVVGRFLSVDPVGPSPGNGFNFNRFAYASNEPIHNIDPDGRAGIPFGDCSKNPNCLVVSGGSGSSEDTSSYGPNSASRNNPLVPNLGIARAATADANKALKDALQVRYPNLDEAQRAFSSLVQPVADLWNTEIGSKLFEVGGKIMIGGAISDGASCSQNAGCFVFLWEAPSIPGGMLQGITHTHPNNLGLSTGDLAVTYKMRERYGMLNDLTVYASGPNGRSNKWSTKAMRETPKATWSGYLSTTTWIP